MARNETAREEDSEKTTYGRRTFMKLVGVSAATAAAAGAVSGNAKAANYETVKVSSGQTKRYSLGSGDTLENVLIDVTAKGASVSIRAHGSGWTIRNVGVKGTIDVERPEKIIIPSVSSGGVGVIDGLYMGDGAITNGSTETSLGAIWVNATKHRGTLKVRNAHIGGWADNGLYGSGPAYQLGPDAGGPVQIDNCYGRNNNISSFRVGTNGSYVRNTTVEHVCDDANLARSEHPSPYGSRGIWLKDNGNIPVSNCQVSVTGKYTNTGVIASHGASGSLKDSQVVGGVRGVSTANVGSKPTLSIPDGVPKTPEEAASGGSSGGSVPDQEDSESKYPSMENTLSISGKNSDGAAKYEVTVSGELAPSTAMGGSVNDEDNIDGKTVVGEVFGGVDSYGFDGEISKFQLDGNADVYVNGNQISPDVLGLNNSLRISGTSSTRTDYAFEVDGDLAFDVAIDEQVNAEDEIEAAKGTGAVAGGDDKYRFSGKITSFDLSGSAAEVYVNGQLTDPSTLGSKPTTEEPTTEEPTTEEPTTEEPTTEEPTTEAPTTSPLPSPEDPTATPTPEEELPNVIILDSTNATDVTEYTFGVSGDIKKSAELGSLNDEDSVQDGVAKGAIAGGKDAYRFSGSLTRFKLDGAAAVTVKHGSN